MFCHLVVESLSKHYDLQRRYGSPKQYFLRILKMYISVSIFSVFATIFNNINLYIISTLKFPLSPYYYPILRYRANFEHK